MIHETFRPLTNAAFLSLFRWKKCSASKSTSLSLKSCFVVFGSKKLKLLAWRFVSLIVSGPIHLIKLSHNSSQRKLCKFQCCEKHFRLIAQWRMRKKLAPKQNTQRLYGLTINENNSRQIDVKSFSQIATADDWSLEEILFLALKPFFDR